MQTLQKMYIGIAEWYKESHIATRCIDLHREIWQLDQRDQIVKDTSQVDEDKKRNPTLQINRETCTKHRDAGIKYKQLDKAITQVGKHIQTKH